MTATEQFIEDAKDCLVCFTKIVRDKKLSQKQWERKKYCSFKCGGVAMRERNPTAWNKGKKCPELGRENHHLWKGGVTSENEKIRKSQAYKDWRTSVFIRDDYTCQSCGVKGGNLQADHVLPFSLYPDLRFELLNGRTLCIPCHRATDTYGHNIHSYE